MTPPLTEEAVVADAEELSCLRFQRCTWCDSAQPRPSLMCRVCHSEDFRWEYSEGFGRIVVVPPPSAWKAATPQLTMLQLDEGPLVDGRVLGGLREQLCQGARVRFNGAESSVGRPVFELTPD